MLARGSMHSCMQVSLLLQYSMETWPAAVGEDQDEQHTTPLSILNALHDVPHTQTTLQSTVSCYLYYQVLQVLTLLQHPLAQLMYLLQLCKNPLVFCGVSHGICLL